MAGWSQRSIAGPPGSGQCGNALKQRTHGVLSIGLKRLVFAAREIE